MSESYCILFHTNISKKTAEQELKAYESQGWEFNEDEESELWTKKIVISFQGNPVVLEQEIARARTHLEYGNRNQKFALDALTVYNLAYACMKTENDITVLPKPESLGFEFIPKN